MSFWKYDKRRSLSGEYRLTGEEVPEQQEQPPSSETQRTDRRPDETLPNETLPNETLPNETLPDECRSLPAAAGAPPPSSSVNQALEQGCDESGEHPIVDPVALRRVRVATVRIGAALEQLRHALEELGSVADGRPRRPARLQGRLDELELVLTALELGHEGGWLEVSGPQGDARILFRHGDACRGELDGEPADGTDLLEEVVDWSEGSFALYEAPSKAG